MTEKSGPYIGVTGFMSRDEVMQALMSVSRETAYRLMVGVLMNSETLAGQTNKWPGRYPKREAVADIFIDDPRTLNLIHYNTDTPNMLVSEVRQIVELAGPDLDGLQFNVAWPAPSQIEQIREMYPNLYLLLQIGGRAMQEVLSFGIHTEERLEECIGWYIPFIDAVLFDPSGGKGEPFSVAGCHPWIRAAREFPGLEVGVAGGLGPVTTNVIESLAKQFPGLNIDAEGRLRTPQPEDALDLRTVKDYLVVGHLILEGDTMQI